MPPTKKKQKVAVKKEYETETDDEDERGEHEDKKQKASVKKEYDAETDDEGDKLEVKVSDNPKDRPSICCECDEEEDPSSNIPILLCVGCDNECHLTCALDHPKHLYDDGCNDTCRLCCAKNHPKLTKIPEGDWYCSTCVKKKIDAAANRRREEHEKIWKGKWKFLNDSRLQSIAVRKKELDDGKREKVTYVWNLCTKRRKEYARVGAVTDEKRGMLIVLPKERYEFWHKILVNIEKCRTWGDIRDLGDEFYKVVLERRNYFFSQREQGSPEDSDSIWI